MTPLTAYLMVGVVAAIAGQETGILGMMMLLVAWPVFVLAGLAVHGLPSVLVIVLHHPDPELPTMDLRQARLLGKA